MCGSHQKHSMASQTGQQTQNWCELLKARAQSRAQIQNPDSQISEGILPIAQRNVQISQFLSLPSPFWSTQGSSASLEICTNQALLPTALTNPFPNCLWGLKWETLLYKETCLSPPTLSNQAAQSSWCDTLMRPWHAVFLCPSFHSE